MRVFPQERPFHLETLIEITETQAVSPAISRNLPTVASNHNSPQAPDIPKEQWPDFELEMFSLVGSTGLFQRIDDEMQEFLSTKRLASPIRIQRPEGPNSQSTSEEEEDPESEESGKIYVTPKQRRQDRDFLRWRAGSRAISVPNGTPTRGINRSTTRDVSMDTSTWEDSNSSSEDPYNSLIMSPSGTLVPDRAIPRSFRVAEAYDMRDKYEGLIDQRNLDRLGMAGKKMTVEVAQEHLDNASQSVGYTSCSESFCSLMPPGLMDERVWDHVRKEMERAANPPRTTSTRAERAAAREARRERLEK